MSKLTDLDINTLIAELSGMKVVSGNTLNTPDPESCYVELEYEGKTCMQKFDCLDGTSLLEQLVKMNELDVSWHGGQVTVTLPPRLTAVDFDSYTDCNGDVARACCMLILNASGLDGGNPGGGEPYDGPKLVLH